MDPNSGKKNMFNKLSRQDCLNILESERFRRKTVSFYKYTHFTKLPFFRDELYKEWNELNILGRIYIASEGINAQISVPEHNWIKFKKKMESRPEFADMPFKIAIEDDGKSFLKLTIKIREKIVGDGLPQGSYDVTNVGKHLSAKEWNQEMDNGEIIMRVRLGNFKEQSALMLKLLETNYHLLRIYCKEKRKRKYFYIVLAELGVKKPHLF